MNIAFQHLGSDSWVAGNITLKNIFLALRSLENQKLGLFLVVSEDTAQDDYRSLLPYVDKVLTLPKKKSNHELLLQWSLRYHLTWWLSNKLVRKKHRNEIDPLKHLLMAHQVDCLFSHVRDRQVPSSIPYVAWIPDFQHIHLPEMFTLDERALRDRIFLEESEKAQLVFLKSETVCRDFAAFSPIHASKGRVIDFVVYIPPSVYGLNPNELVSLYHLPKKFIYIPNQFWKHKNHTRVWEALYLLKKRAVQVTVVCTGSPIDQRNPDHFVNLMRLASEWDLREQVVYLGLVPQEHVFGLMRQSICVLNASLFEGFGLSAAECKSLGKQLLLSDLPALREQNPPGAIYFDPYDANDLAEKIEAIWNTTEPGPDLDLERAARAQWPQRQREFAQAFLKCLQEAIAVKQPKPH